MTVYMMTATVKKEKCQQCKYSIPRTRRSLTMREIRANLTFVVEKFAVHSILIIVDHILFSTDSLIECIILLERDLIDTDRSQEEDFLQYSLRGQRARDFRLEYLKCFFSGDRCDCRSEKVVLSSSTNNLASRSSEYIHSENWLGERYMIIYSLDKSLRCEEYKEKNIHKKINKGNDKDRRKGQEWITDNITKSVLEDAHEKMKLRIEVYLERVYEKWKKRTKIPLQNWSWDRDNKWWAI